MKTKIMILEDDPGINQLLATQLAAEGFEVLQAYDGEEAINLFDSTVDMAVLDIMVPKKDGYQVLEHIRTISHIPILFLTARNDDLDKIRALGLGADDYVEKPFSLIEVIYRCKAHLRRYKQYHNTTESIIYHGELCLNRQTFEVTYKNQPLTLNLKEFELLAFFMNNIGQVFTKQQLYEKVWGEDYFGDDNTVMVHISRIRDKLKDDPKKPKYIKTIKGLGYRMEKFNEENR